MKLSNPVQFIDRTSGKLVTESVMGDKALRFAYETLLGHCISGLLFNSSALSSLLGKYYDSRFSKKSINSLASIPGCMPQEAELPLEEYKSFNDFFTRRLKPGSRPFCNDANSIASPADGRIMVYENLQDMDAIPVKGAKRTLNDLCANLLNKSSYAVAVIRLAPVDYHRYHYPCACVQTAETVKLKGKYHSVNPVALAANPDVYVENARHITELDSEVFGRFYFLEVGAFGVGSINSTSGVGMHNLQDEKGYFKFGGSTVILVFENSSIQWDSDLLENTLAGKETLIRCGMQIAKKRV